MPVLTPSKVEMPRAAAGGGGRAGGLDTAGGGGGWGGHAWSVPQRAYHTGMWMGLIAIFMLFAAFTSAMVVRRGLSDDWGGAAIPSIFYANTLVLLASSGTLELARRSLARPASEPYGPRPLEGRFSSLLYATLALGALFIAGQLLGWKQLRAQDLYLKTNPASSFFYLLTAAHGLHLAGGIAALGYVAWRARAIARGLKRRTAVDLTAIYWHFMDALWIYILILLKARL